MVRAGEEFIMTKKMPTIQEIQEEFKRTGKRKLVFDLRNDPKKEEEKDEHN